MSTGCEDSGLQVITGRFTVPADTWNHAGAVKSWFNGALGEGNGPECRVESELNLRDAAVWIEALLQHLRARNTGAHERSVAHHSLHGVSPDKVRRERLVFLAVFILILGSGCTSKENRNDSDATNVQITRRIFYPAAKGPFPAVLVLPTTGSSSAHADGVCQRLAKEGYVARAMSYGRVSSGILSDAKRLDRLKHLASQSLASLRIQPGVDPNRIGVIGFSFGGFFATYLASSPDENGLRAAVIYYGVYQVPEFIKNLKVPILAFQGDADSHKAFIDHA